MDTVTAFAAPVGGILLFVAGVWGVLRFIRWGNRYWSTTPGRRTADAIEAEYKGAGIALEDGALTLVAKGTLQSVPFVVTLYPSGNPPRALFEVPDANGPDFSFSRKGDGMREFIRLGAGHSMQTGSEGMDPGIESLPAIAEREAVRALFHLGFEELERGGGRLRAVKYFCQQLPELEVLRRALDQLRVLRSGIQT
jgi:hypothetical protein